MNDTGGKKKRDTGIDPRKPRKFKPGTEAKPGDKTESVNDIVKNATGRMSRLDPDDADLDDADSDDALEA